MENSDSILTCDFDDHQIVHHGKDGEHVSDGELSFRMNSVRPECAGVDEATVRLSGSQGDVADKVA